MKSLRERILEGVSERRSGPLKPGALLKQLKLSRQEVPEFWELLDELLAGGELREDRAGRLKRVAADQLLTGTVRRLSSGHGLFVTEGADVARYGTEISVSRDEMATAYSGDRVRLQLLGRRGRGGLRTGRVMEVLARGTQTFVGTCTREKARRYVVEVLGKVFSQPFRVDDAQAAGAGHGDKVVVEILRFPPWGSQGEAVIVEVLDESSVDVDVEAVRRQFGLPGEFPDVVLNEARRVAEQFDAEDVGERLDLREACVLTIDPASARDFDDAISLEREADGMWRLGVHIADVGHFVRPGSKLDQEAQARGTSIYLGGRVIPMFPPLLSNGLASLQQDEVRLTKSVFLDFDESGAVQGKEFFNSVIRVRQRLSYEQAAAVLGLPGGEQAVAPELAPEVDALLRRMHELSRVLRHRRLAAGAFDLNLSETELVFDEHGKLTGARERKSDESHQIIEEFMLAANIAVARALAEQGQLFLRRIHSAPSWKKLTEFSEFVGVLGFRLSKTPDREQLLKILDEARGTPVETSVHFGLLRSLKRAEYGPDEVGHFALNEHDYCHFTSPIRRYPDLTVHRLFERCLARKQKRGRSELERVREIGRQCSILERRAEKAEREVTRTKLLRLIEPRIGQTWETVVTGVERFGVFCQGLDLPAEGLLPIEAMRDDIYDFDVEQWCLLGRRANRPIRIGSRLKVMIQSVDIDRRELRLELPGEFSSRTEGPQLAQERGRDQSRPRKRRQSAPRGAKRRRRR